MITKQILGKVLPLLKGNYDENITYSFLDIVTYNGSSYISKIDDNRDLPTESASWQLYAKQGLIGPTGPQGIPGYTPQRGTDYFTTDDMNYFNTQIVSKVDEKVGVVEDDLEEWTEMIEDLLDEINGEVV